MNTYDATGRKLRAEYLKAGTQDTLRTDYCGNLIYEQGRPEMLLVDGGYVTFNDNSNANDSLSFGEGLGGVSYHYYLTDHLGNNRVVVNSNDSIEQVNHYYPYGGLMAESTGGDTQRYKYNGKELDRMHGLDWYDYGARWMNGLTFTTPDPKAWDYTDVSPYVYCMNNPIKLIDPDGKDIYIYFTDKNGKDYTYRFDGTKDKNLPDNQYVRDFVQAYNFVVGNGGGDNLKKAATNHDMKIYVSNESNSSHFVSGRKPTVYWKSRQGLETTEGGRQSPATVLEHEFDHAVDNAKNHKIHDERGNQKDKQYDNKEERRVITGSERKTAKANGESLRYNHKGKPYVTVSPISVKPKYKKQ